MSKQIRVGFLVTVPVLVVGAQFAAVAGAEADGHFQPQGQSAKSVPSQMPSSPNTNVAAPALSYTGRFVAFVGVRRDHVSAPHQLRRFDFTSGRTELLNRSIDGGVARGNKSLPPVISNDGKRVAFTSSASDLVTDDTNGRIDAFVRDASTNSTSLASVAFMGGVANDDSTQTSLSKSGRYVAFISSATDVVPSSTTTNADVYRRDLDSHTTEQVTVRPDGSPSKGPGASSADVSANGNLIAFTSYNIDLTSAETPDSDADLFVRNMSTGVTRWLSATAPPGANPSGVVISPNGRWISTRWDDGSLHLTKVRSGHTSTVVVDGYAETGAFSAQTGRFVYMSAGVPTVLDLASQVSTALATPDDGVVSTVTISGDGHFAAYDWIPDDGGSSLIFRIAL